MSDFFTIYLNGLLTGASLIIAIGAQNAFVLTRAIEGRQAHAVAGLCAFIDIVLISLGVCGLGSLVAGNEILRAIATFGGAGFLIWFGLRSFIQALRIKRLDQEAHTLVPSKESAKNKGDLRRDLRHAMAATLAISLLNPHVYLDTVIMLGAISGNYPGFGRYFFGLGAITASVIWFFSLSFAGSKLAPIFARPRSWIILYTLVGLMVWWVAAGLLLDYYHP
ncbi:MAG: LysE/ArgO family amino acid transporter [Deltaproteobacteria bacterium]|jgi:L-lysine exporter family protein LysE/ArgO|nr:LysE/ArgO family amino acid transporter [Deltaproteobacteria bacterium]